MKKISVIIPIYNTKKELKRCLESILNQQYKNIELVCVDDGSTDGSEKLLDIYAQNDKRIVAIHQENKGESNARNVGLRHTSGEYIAFCDCDDWIDTDMYSIMVEEIEKNDLDMVAASWYKETKEKSIVVENELTVSDDIFGRKQLLKYVYMRDSYRGFAYIWDKIYKKDVLLDEDGEWIKFDESIRLGGDVIYLAQAALNISKAKYINRAFYHYNQREASGSHTKDVEKLKDWIKSYEIVIKLFQNEGIDEKIISFVKRFLAYHSSNATEIAIECNDIIAKKYFQSIMKCYMEDYISLNSQHADRVQRYMKLLIA